MIFFVRMVRRVLTSLVLANQRKSPLIKSQVPVSLRVVPQPCIIYCEPWQQAGQCDFVSKAITNTTQWLTTRWVLWQALPHTWIISLPPQPHWEDGIQWENWEVRVTLVVSGRAGRLDLQAQVPHSMSLVRVVRHIPVATLHGPSGTGLDDSR